MKSICPLVRLLACLIAASLGAGLAQAHDDHEPLPTSGVTVVGERLLVSADARQAIDLTTAKVTLADLAEQVTLAATTEAPCHQHAVAATLAQGRIVEVLAHPGQPVERGQTLARFESLELERLQSELLSAAATFDLITQLRFLEDLCARNEALDFSEAVEALYKRLRREGKT